MRSLSAREVLEVFEAGRCLHPIDRALTLLAAASPERSREALAALSLGERDARLLALHESMCGPELLSYAECAACGQGLELNVPVADLRGAASRCATTPEVLPEDRLVCDDFELRLRSVTSRDLAAAAGAADARSARRILAERCILEMWHQATRIEFAAVPEAAIDRLIDHVSNGLSDLDPAAETLLDLECPACGQHSSTLLDVGEFLWHKIVAFARRLLREIHVLARSYHWSESEILNLSASRRRAYLEMLHA